MKKLLALLLALCMVLCLAACGSQDDGEDEDKKKDKQSQVDDDDEVDNNDSLREGLTAYDSDGLRVYLGDEFDGLEFGYAESEDMEISVSYLLNDEVQEFFGESIGSAADLLDTMVDMSLEATESAEVLEQGVKNGVDYACLYNDAEDDFGYYVHGVYYEGGCFWYVSIFFEDESLADTAIKYATICEVVGLPEEDEDYGDEDYEDDPEELVIPDAEDVLAIFENEDILIQVFDFQVDSIMGGMAELYIKNKSDVELTISSGMTVVDGLTCDGVVYTTVGAGEELNDTLYVDAYIPDGEPACTYSEVKMELRIYDSENYSDDETRTTLTFHPTGKSSIDQYTREAKDTDVLLVDNDYVTVWLIAEENDDIFGYSGWLYMVSKTDLDLEFETENENVDGAGTSGYVSSNLAGNTVCYAELSFFDEDYESLMEAEDVSLTLIAKVVRDWFGDNVFEENISY